MAAPISQFSKLGSSHRGVYLDKDGNRELPMDTNPRFQNDAGWAADLSARLRALQSSFADGDASERQQYLAEEIGRALQEVVPADRSVHLQALAECFPVWDEAPTAAAVSPAALAPEDSPEELARKLIAFGPQLSEPGRAVIARQLAAGGFEIRSSSAPASTSPVAMDFGNIPPELQKRLGLEADQPLDGARVLRLVASLSEFMVTLDHLSWSVWKNLAPKSVVRRDTGEAGDFRKIAAPYLLGDAEVSTAQINLAVDKTRQLIAGLLAAVGATGETFARQFLSRFSPVAIKESADADAGFFLGPEQKCWRRYITVFNETSGAAVEQELSKIIVKYTESLITGTHSESPPDPQ